VTRSSAKARPEIPLFSNLQEASSNEIRSAGIGTPSEGLSLCDSAFCSTERQLCTRARPIPVQPHCFPVSCQKFPVPIVREFAS
jgi:hypothetical protein